jgi:uncharacterized membrane protein
VLPSIVLVAIFAAMAAGKYYALGSFFFDLESVLTSFNYLNDRGETGRIFLGHAHVVAVPYLAALKGIPGNLAAPVILTLQALALATPFWFLYRDFGRLAAYAFVLYVPLWINNHFDFHFDHLAVPLLLWFFFSAKARNAVGATVAALLLMMVKEPFALQTMACGVFLLWIGLRPSLNSVEMNCRRFIIAGLVLVVVGGVYFYFATHYLIPYFSGGARGGLDAGAFSWMGHSLGQMIGYLVTHPMDILWGVVSTPGKLTYLFVVFGLLAFIPLLAPSYLIPALPLLAIAMLSRLPNYYDYNTHYTAGLIIPVMLAFIHGLPKAHALWMRGARWVWRNVSGIRVVFLTRVATPLPGPFPQGEKRLGGQAGEGIYLLGENALVAVREARLSKAFYVLLAVWVLAGHVMLSPSPISRLFWSDKVWSYSWHVYVSTEREDMMKQAMFDYIPTDPDVSITTQNTVNWHHLVNRKVYLPFPLGVDIPHRVMDWSNRDLPGLWQFVRTGLMPPAITHARYADYVVLDLKRPWFIIDKGCDWLYGACRNNEMAAEFLRLVDETHQRYSTVFEQDGFMILKRK